MLLRGLLDSGPNCCKILHDPILDRKLNERGGLILKVMSLCWPPLYFLHSIQLSVTKLVLPVATFCPNATFSVLKQ